MIKQLTFTIVALLALTAPAGRPIRARLADVAAKEFDHEFAGKLIITRANREELDRLCAGALPSGRKIACAAVPAPGATECRIRLLIRRNRKT
jgi:hypothetical protein